MHTMLNEDPGVTCIEPQGAFLLLPERVRAPRLRDRRAHADTLELAEHILAEARVAVVPGEAFGAPGYVRLSFAVSDDAITEGLKRISALVSS